MNKKAIIITPIELDAMDARCDGATKGPWLEINQRGCVGLLYANTLSPPILSTGYYNENENDIKFAGYARTDMPQLIKAARGVLKALNKITDEARAVEVVREIGEIFGVGAFPEQDGV